MATTIDGVPIPLDRPIELADSDYLYGSGPLVVLFREVLGAPDFRDERWVELRVDQVVFGGQLIARPMMVRLAAIRAAGRARAAR